MTPQKRLFDVALALIAVVLFALPMALIAAILLLVQGRPIFYRSERMKTPQVAFWLWKFRTMRESGQNTGVTGGDKSARITGPGHFLRRTRLDELPQLWNILRGDISFVGPRPPLHRYVVQFPQAYGQVLRCRPGVTGLATLVFHAREERLLAACTTATQTDSVYKRRCLPRKLRLDLVYAENQSLALDLALLWRTVGCVLKKRKAG